MFERKIAFLVLAASGCASVGANAQGVAKVGDHPSYAWQKPLANGRGAKSLADLRGRPVIVDFWGTHCPPCVGTAVPAAIKLQEEFGDEIQVILVESQGSSLDQVEHFAMTRKWASERAIWTTEAPFETGVNTIPHCIVLSNDGEVLLNDNPIAAHAKIEQLIDEQLKLAKKGPKDLAPTCAKAWADFEKGSYAAAIDALDAVKDGAEKEGAAKLSTQLQARLAAKVARLAWYVENAEFDAADKLAPSLAANVKGTKAEEKVKELAAKLAAKEMAPEREAAKALERIESKIAKDGYDETLVKPLNSLSEKFAQTIAGKRAAHLATVIKTELQG